VRILTTASRLDGIGGLERAQLDACRQLRSRGHQIDLLYIEPGDLTPEWEEITERRVRVSGYSFYRRAPADSLRSVAGVVAAIRRLAPDVVYVHDHRGTPGPALAGRPLVCHLHLQPPTSRSWQDHFALRRSRGLIAVSRFTAERWSESLGLPVERFAVVANGVDPSRFCPADAATRAQVRASLGLPTDRFLILFAGRVDPEKGVQRALEAMTLLEPREFHLAIAGDANPGSFGGDRAKAQAYAQDLRARHTNGAVTWLGRLQDVSSLLAAADAVVLPSLVPDSLPLIVLESLACGTPIVASAVGGIPEMLTGPLAANLIPAVEPGLFAQRLYEIRNWRATNPELGALGREHVERNYTLPRMGERVDEAIEVAMRPLTERAAGQRS
jgi:glycosyltransferase involved in cell wall biosynthesis